jgi:hypothetical protein
MEKLSVAQLANIIPVIYGIQRFTAELTRALKAVRLSNIEIKAKT